MGDKPEIVREARLENLASLIEFVEKACRQTNAEQQICLDIRLAVEEVCTNLIRHGYAGMEPGPIRSATSPTPQAGLGMAKKTSWRLRMAPDPSGDGSNNL